MIALVASLVERSRGADLRLHLSTRDYTAIAGGKVRCFIELLSYYGHNKFFHSAGFSISVPTNQGQHKSASDTTFDTCTLPLGRTASHPNHFDAVQFGDETYRTLRSVLQAINAVDRIVWRTIWFALFLAIGLAKSLGRCRILSSVGSRLAGHAGTS